MRYRVFTWDNSVECANYCHVNLEILKSSEFYQVNGRLVSLLKKHVGNDVEYDSAHGYYYVTRDGINAIKAFLDKQGCLNCKKWRWANHLHVSYRPKQKDLHNIEIALVGED